MFTLKSNKAHLHVMVAAPALECLYSLDRPDTRVVDSMNAAKVWLSSAGVCSSSATTVLVSEKTRSLWMPFYQLPHLDCRWPQGFPLRTRYAQEEVQEPDESPRASALPCPRALSLKPHLCQHRDGR